MVSPGTRLHIRFPDLQRPPGPKAAAAEFVSRGPIPLASSHVPR